MTFYLFFFIHVYKLLEHRKSTIGFFGKHLSDKIFTVIAILKKYIFNFISSFYSYDRKLPKITEKSNKVENNTTSFTQNIYFI